MEHRWIETRVVRAGERSIRGSALLVSGAGISVISDVDDTLRVSEVGDTARLLRRTLVEPAEAVPGMAALLTRLAGEGGSVHYVTGTPWQLYPELAGFLRDAGFPRGTFHMRSFRFKEESALEILRSPIEFKAGACRELLEALPERRFVLVGDTTEDDAAVYAGLAAEFPGRVAYIAIRAAPGDHGGEARAREALRGVTPERWRVFADPGEVDAGQARQP